MANSEAKFYKELKKVFVGANIDGIGGFVRLMKIKSKYYQQIEQQIRKDIASSLGEHDGFREELFTKLYSFFSRYFTQNGSICFNDTPFHNNIYEQVYDNKEDVSLFWKTRMLYYVKTERLYENLTVLIDDYKFNFDCSELENKKTNEKQHIVFELSNIDKKEGITIQVKKSNNGKKTEVNELLKLLQNKDFDITEEQLNNALGLFQRKTEADFFINKDAKAFLEEQFKLWSYQYFWDGSTEWSADRVQELQIMKEIAFNIIAFISQFEDELVKIWNKPKFVRKSNYVITMDRLSKELQEKVKKFKGYKLQVKEWAELGIDSNGPKVPIDTKFFKELELEIIGQFDNLDEALDGRLIKSENYQALNTILPKFKEKVQCVYIDPPFNTGNDFVYEDKFQDSTWLSLMTDRLSLTKNFMSDTAYIYLQLDHYADYLGRILLKNTFSNSGIDSQSFITWNTGDNISGFKTQRNNWIRQADKILLFPKNPDIASFIKMWSPVQKEANKKIGWLDFIGPSNGHLYIEKWNDGKMLKEKVDVHSKRIGTVWNDIYSFQYSEPRETESFSFKTQKPENLLRRIIQSCSNPREIVLDFFSGIGTTVAVSQKINRKWIGVELGEHIGNFYYESDIKKVGVLGRMKIVLNGDTSFTLPNTDQIRKPHLSKDVNWEGGGFFKYYELEQYEDTLRNTRYSKDSELFTQTESSVYEQYVFLPDEKMLNGIEVNSKDNSIKVNLSNLYDDIDVAETLSNLIGKPIKSITKDKLILEDDPKDIEIDLNNLDPHLIKPLIWWE